MLKELYRELGVAWRMALRIYDRQVSVSRDIAKQKRALGQNASPAITRHDRLRDRKGDAVAVVVLYRPDGEVPADLLRLCAALDGRDIHVCLVANHPLSPAQRDAFAAHAGEMFERENAGYDFGAYRAVALDLLARDDRPDRLILLNDSVFYSSRGLDDFVSRLLGDADAIAAFENWAEGYHLQSFALSLGPKVVSHPAFAEFWRDYVPVSNRIHAIESGEKVLSAVIHDAAETIEVIYSVARLSQALQDAGDADADIIRYPMGWRKTADYVLGRKETSAFGRLRLATSVISATSPIHAGAWFFPRYLDCPLFKKDIVIRERFGFWEVEEWTRDLLPEDERQAFLRELRARGEPGMLSPSERRRKAVGL